MTEDELKILRSFLLNQHLDSLEDGSPYKYLQIKVIGGKKENVAKLVSMLSHFFSARTSRIHQCSVEIDPEVKVAWRGERCWRCYLKVYLPERLDEDLTISYEETIKSLKTEIRDLEMIIGELHSRIERLKLHR
jgi:hypothetical protein